MKKGFSVITAFGCVRDCSYCIWKKHPLKDSKTRFESTDWNSLEKAIKEYKGDKISLSGGGDPMCHWYLNRRWFDSVFSIAKKYKKRVDVHTRMIHSKFEKVYPVNQMVISFDHPSELEDIPKALPEVKIRLAKVITFNTTLFEIDSCIEFAKEHGFRITFKELYGMKSKMIQYFARHFKDKGVMFLPDGDYNYYFMPDNKVYDKYMMGEKK